MSRRVLGVVYPRGRSCGHSCLDDDELRYLGAPWEEYARTADELLRAIDRGDSAGGRIGRTSPLSPSPFSSGS